MHPLLRIHLLHCRKYVRLLRFSFFIRSGCMEEHHDVSRLFVSFVVIVHAPTPDEEIGA